MSSSQEKWDDISREVYGICGIPVDNIIQDEVLQQIESATADRRTFLISTPNLNFLILSLGDETFRASLLHSDLCVPDGMPVVWLSRLVGAPIKQRVAGSDLFEALKTGKEGCRPLKVFLFGGPEGVAERACTSLNNSGSQLQCVGWHYPGFGDVEAMSDQKIIAAVNSSGADFLSVSLGAQKGQAWLLRNHERLGIPVRAHLGATINFEVGSVRRAPKFFHRIGLEWLWRIKEEPHLWRRYAGDALGLWRILVKRVLPLLLLRLIGAERQLFRIDSKVGLHAVTVTLKGPAIKQHVGQIIPILANAIATGKPITVDLSGVTVIDARFIGLLLMVYRRTSRQGGMRLVNVPIRVRKFLTLNAFQYLLSYEDA